jgi:site-specific recombinase XerD
MGEVSETTVTGKDSLGVPQLTARRQIDFAHQLQVRQALRHHWPNLEQPDYLLQPEIHAILQLPTINEHHRMLFRFLWNTGARLSEALGVVKADIVIDQTRGLRHVRLRTLKQQRRGRSGREPDGAIRTVPLFDTHFADEFNRYLVTYCRNQTKPVFYSRSNHARYREKSIPVSDATVRRWFKGIEAECCQAGISLSVPLHPHVLRHSYAIHCLLNGVHIKRLQTLLGHRHMSSTEVYTRLLACDIAPDAHLAF